MTQFSRREPVRVKYAGQNAAGGTTSPRYPSSELRWEPVDPRRNYPGELVVYGNYSLNEALEQKVGTRVAWLGESRGVCWWSYEFIEDHWDQFDYVLTYDASLLKLDDRCIYVPRGECWLEPEDVALYPKSRLVSFISSDKEFPKWGATGHGFRQDFYQILTGRRGCLGNRIRRAGIVEQLDCYGKLANRHLPTKLPSLQPYMFQVAVENMIHDAYFTEKIIDCFATGTIPIFRGTRAVAHHFNRDGIIFVDTLEDLTDVLVDLSEDDYHRRIEAVRENYELARAFFSREDLICEYSDILEWQAAGRAR
ncbi:MAG: glycosyltransferase family 10 [Pseudomonadota bacterium]